MSGGPICLDDFQEQARKYLPKSAFDYYCSGANAEQTLAENRLAFKRLRLRPRLLRDVSNVDTSGFLLGRKVRLPIGISPTAMQKMAHHDGEIATSRAAAGHDVCMILSHFSTTSFAEVSMAAPGSMKWFQLYIMKDRSRTERLVREVELSGFTALVLTVDTAVFARRLNDERNEFILPSHITLPNFEEFETLTKQLASRHQAYVETNNLLDTAVTWSDVHWLRSVTKLPIILKGILTAEDAVLAVEHGARGILVSNHGGRQLDGVSATIQALPEVVAAVSGKVDVYLDSGVREGTDVLKALALGAKAVFIGRPVIWGLSFKGEEGVRKVLQILEDELRVAMALSGCQKLSDITPALITHNAKHSML